MPLRTLWSSLLTRLLISLGKSDLFLSLLTLYRNELATALRKRPYQANILLAGYDVDDGATMYYMDYLASMHKVDKAAQGYGAYFTLGLMDRVWREGMSLEECVNLLKKCIAELSTRFMVNLPDFVVKVVDKDGVRIINLGDY